MREVLRHFLKPELCTLSLLLWQCAHSLLRTQLCMEH